MRDPTREPEQPPRRRRAPRKVTPGTLMNAALFYLQRFAASRASLRRVLERKCRRSQAHHGGDLDEMRGWIEEVLDKLERQRFLDDAAFAEARARSLAARGTASRAIRLKLVQQGVDAGLIDQALAALAEEIGHHTDGSPDLVAAVTYARRRRLGPWRPPQRRAEMRDKDLTALARRGFSADIARRVIDAEDIADLEADAGMV